jgi:hypothetical protein
LEFEKNYLESGISLATTGGSGSGTTSAAFILSAQEIDGSTGAAAFVATGRLLGLGTPLRVGDGALRREGDGALMSKNNDTVAALTLRAVF